ncbi:hemerythrin domain-containing protein [Anaeromyxobacter terrae]|uniref:hemerythrin domain-containing protein n=1 Tax=Anaeromyxobacter terrae TaxID=2925406 RepID=UPI001F57BE8E|nr:hemerythrin domain-containing protein [Anaeromyxobacter sp. SG22]
MRLTAAGPIARHLTDDHAYLDALLDRAVPVPGTLDREAFDAFRAGLLRHIALEEKILLPATRRARGGEPLPAARQLRIEHGALASLLVPTPTAELVTELRSILVPHDAREEEPGGVYDQCDALLAGEAEALVQRMREYPPVRVAPYADGPRVLRTAEAALRQSAASHGGG